MAAVDRLSDTDELMLWADEAYPQEIAALGVLDGAGFEIGAVKRLVESRLHLVPRFRQLLRIPPKGFGGPYWIDDPAFDLDAHIGVSPLPSPAGEVELLAAARQVWQCRLDRHRPLWEMRFFTGLDSGRVGMFVRTHHAVADGMAGIATLGMFLDTAEDAAPAAPEPWTPVPAPTDGDLQADAASRRRSARRRTAGRFAHPVATMRQALAIAPAMRELFADPSVPPTSLDHRIGPRRNLALVRSRLDPVREVAHRHDAKVNDVFLTAIAGGLRGLLLSRGERVEGVVMRIYVPISLRHGGPMAAQGNQVTQMAVPLNIGVADPVARLHEISAETARRKARARPSLGGFPMRGLARRGALWLIERQRVNVESADLPGPPMTLYLAGMRVLEVFPLLPLISRVSLGVGALSYAGNFYIAAVADGDLYPDLEVFTAGLSADLRSLA